MSPMILPSPVGKWVGDRLFELTEPYRITVTGIGVVEIDAGFTYDGQSIPRIVWPITGEPFAGKSQPAALVHDALCRSKLVARARADMAFRQLLDANGSEKSAVKFWAVRCAGRLGIPHYRRAVVEAARKQVRIWGTP